MIKLKVFSLIVFLLLGISVWGQSFFPMATSDCGNIADLALIYYGGVHRWYYYYEDDFIPFLTWTDPDTNVEKWLFDGFLFIEFRDGMEHEFADGYGYLPARKQEWEWYLYVLFAENRGPRALDNCIASTIDRIGNPVQPRKVVITLPEPIYGQTDWGSIDGTELNFYSTNDQLAACEWYLDELEQRWNAANFKNIELVGIYWVAERSPVNGTILIPLVSQAIHNHGWKFFWIPYWNASGAGDWNSLGFDVAYQQPNYFFTTSIPKSRLNQALQFSKNNGMGMEMEWDNRVVYNTDPYRDRMEDYMDAYENSGFLDVGAQAHYLGGTGMNDIVKSTDPLVISTYNRYCKIITDRQAILYPNNISMWIVY